MGLVQAFKDSFNIKSAAQPSENSYRYRTTSMLHGERNYQFDVGTGDGSSLIQAVVGYYSRTYPEAPLMLVDPSGEEIHKHPFLSLVRMPNPSYSGVVLAMATMMSWICDGNAYWRKVRSGSGRVVEYWYVPHWLLEPKWPEDGSTYISHYEYSPGSSSGKIKIMPDDIVHFRYGLDPYNTRKGYSWVKTLLREIYTDEEAARFVAAMLRNLGIIGLVVSPKEQDDALTDDEAEAMKTLIKQRTTGDQRGDPIVSSSPIDVVEISKTSDRFDTSKLRAVPESRVSALSGIPAAVLGFLSGMEQTSVGATMSELRELAYESALIPTQRIICAEMTIQALNDFIDDVSEWNVAHNYSLVRVLQEDKDKMWTRVITAFKEGTIMLSEARKTLGFESIPDEEIYLRKTTFQVIRREDVGNPMLEPEQPEDISTPPEDEQVITPPKLRSLG